MPVRIGCHSAMWGDTSLSAPQLIRSGGIDFLVGDYLAEVTMAILARMHQKSKKLGYATDFIQTMAAHLPEIKKRGIKVVVNAGGVNPAGCRDALLGVAEKHGVSLKVGVVTGDDLMGRTDELRKGKTEEMYSGRSFPPKPVTMSCNAYLGAFPIAKALDMGCDVVITGRCVDSALVLAPLIHKYGWKPTDYDKLCAGTLAGHLVECGAQGTGGLFTDFEASKWVNIGYPIVEVNADGTFILTKPPKTDGVVCPAAAAEQLVYEIGDPGAYHVPDVACDFTQVKMEQAGEDRVLVTGARGQPPTDTYKCCATYFDGYHMSAHLVLVGRDAVRKAEKTADTLLTRWRAILSARKLGDFTATHVELIGGGGSRFAQPDVAHATREIVLRIGVKHNAKKALDIIRKEVGCSAVSMAQGTIFIGGLPSPSPSVCCFSFLVPKKGVLASVEVQGEKVAVPVPTDGGFVTSASATVVPVKAASAPPGATHKVPLERLCWARSGDKGDIANIGVIARDPSFLPYLRSVLTPERVKAHFARTCKGKVERFDMPGINGMNFLLHNALGGGGTSSLFSDPLAKTCASVLLSMQVDVPVAWSLPSPMTAKL